MKRLLLVFAHPDDESFSCGGTVAKYVEDGWHVDLICATRGEKAGDGDIRQKELQKAGVELGISTITFLGYQDGTLGTQAAGELEDAVYKKMEELVPDAVITMDTTGTNNNPDHMKMSFVTTYAFQKYGVWIEEKLKDQEEAIQAFPKLYYACMPESIIRYAVKTKILPTDSFGKPLVGTEDKKITTVIDIMEYAEIKQKALHCHVTQAAKVERYVRMNAVMKHEYFILRMQGVTEVFMGKNDHVANNL